VPDGAAWRFVPDGALGRGRRRGAKAPSRGTSRVIRGLQLLAALVLLGGLAYTWTAKTYRDAYHAQLYCESLRFYRDLVAENDAVSFERRRAEFEARAVGTTVRVIGRVGALEPATAGTTHPDGPAVFLWVNVPNLFEEADSTPLDVRCTLAHAQLDLPPAGGGAHRHRWRQGALVVVEGTLRRLSVDSSGTRATVVLEAAHARAPGPIEAWFWADEAQALGARRRLRGLGNLDPEDE
jgi:hypothetical protein